MKTWISPNLYSNDEDSQFLVPFRLKVSKNTGSEEDLGLSDSIQPLIQIELVQHCGSSLSTVHKTGRDGIRSQYLVPEMQILVMEFCNSMACANLKFSTRLRNSRKMGMGPWCFREHNLQVASILRVSIRCLSGVNVLSSRNSCNVPI